MEAALKKCVCEVSQSETLVVETSGQEKISDFTIRVSFDIDFDLDFDLVSNSKPPIERKDRCD